MSTHKTQGTLFQSLEGTHTHIRNSQPYQLHVSAHALTGQAFSTNKKSTTHQIQPKQTQYLHMNISIQTSTTKPGDSSQNGPNLLLKEAELTSCCTFRTSSAAWPAWLACDSTSTYQSVPAPSCPDRQDSRVIQDIPSHPIHATAHRPVQPLGAVSIVSNGQMCSSEAGRVVFHFFVSSFAHENS